MESISVPAVVASPGFFSTKRRAGRVEWLYQSLLIALLVWGVVCLMCITEDVVIHVVLVLLMIPLFILSLIITIRRLHDFGLSGWWSLLWFPGTMLPSIGPIFAAFLAVKPGDGGENNFGTLPAKATKIWQEVLATAGGLLIMASFVANFVDFMEVFDLF